MAEKYPLVLNGTNIEELQSGDSIAGAIDSVSEDTSPNLGGNLNTGSYNVSFGDNAKALFGASNDLQIYHDGSNSYIAESGTGNLFITSSGDQIQLRSSGGATMVRAYTGGETQLFHNGNNKLQTTSTGVSVTGNVTATSFTGDGSNLTGVGVDGVSSSATGTAITIDSSDEVGIGSSSPVTKLQVSPTASDGSVVDAMMICQDGLYGVGTGVSLLMGGRNTTTRCAKIEAVLESGSNAHRLAFYTNPNGASPSERMRITSGGELQVDTTDSAIYNATSGTGMIKIVNNALVVAANGGNSCFIGNMTNSSTGNICMWRYNGSNVGTITTTSSSTSYNTTSDYRLKENVVDMDGAIDRVKALQPRRFNFITDANTTVDGFIAHEVSDVIPEAITGTYNAVEVWKEGEELPEGVSVGDNKTDEDGNTIPDYQGIDQSKLVPLLTGALQEAIAKIEALETRIEALENA